jgi:hypothetical protein
MIRRGGSLEPKTCARCCARIARRGAARPRLSDRRLGGSNVKIIGSFPADTHHHLFGFDGKASHPDAAGFPIKNRGRPSRSSRRKASPCSGPDDRRQHGRRSNNPERGALVRSIHLVRVPLHGENGCTCSGPLLAHHEADGSEQVRLASTADLTFPSPL